MDKYIGKRLDGRYEIHEMIGMGGMAYVYRAYDKVEDRWVAIKILKEEFSNNSDFLRRFRNESKAIAMLSNPNIVKIYDVSFGDQIQYIAMEYIDGITLKEYITQQGFIRWQEVLHFLTQILGALETAHQKGIIHRDIKPQNILLLRDGTIKVTDFGIARFLQSETQTMTDKTIGSVHYISPEQARGDYITDKADIYSIGVMMYEMLTGRLPFVSDNAVSVALMQLQAKPNMPREINPEIPHGLEQITMKAMEKNPANRFRSVGEMLSDLEAFRQNPNIIFAYNYLGSDYEAPQRSIADYDTVHEPDYEDNYEYEEELVRSAKRRKGTMAIAGIGIALVLVLLTLGAVYLVNLFKNPQEEEGNIQVPDFIGKIYATEVQGNEEYKDFTFRVQEGNNPDKQPGEVLKQEPEAGLPVKKGREILLTVNKSESPTVTLLDLAGYEQSAAVTSLENQKLTLKKIESINDDEVAIGKVVRTDPVAGSAVAEGSAVTLYVSKGPAVNKVYVPEDLAGDTLANVTQKIKDAGLQVGEIIPDSSSDSAKDTVISTDPASGEEVLEGSTVNIVVSAGKITVPDGLVGDTLANVSGKLEDAGLALGNTTRDDSSDKPVDTVLSVNPQSGTAVAPGSKVDVVVSSGKGIPKTLSQTISLPKVNKDLSLKVYRSGTIETTTTINPEYAGEYTVSFTGTSGEEEIIVELGGQVIYKINFDYDNQVTNITQQNAYTAPPDTSSDNGNAG